MMFEPSERAIDLYKRVHGYHLSTCFDHFIKNNNNLITERNSLLIGIMEPMEIKTQR